MIRSQEWLAFKHRVYDFLPKIADDYEMAATLFWYGRKISPTPFDIRKVKQGSRAQVKKEFRPVSQGPRTAYLNLSELPAEQQEMDQFFNILLAEKYENLVIDARGRKNVRLISILFLADHLSSKPSIGGIYLTRKWTDAGKPVPAAADYTRLLKDSRILGDRGELFSETGIYLKSQPASSIFRGKIYLLIDGRTSGLAEAFSAWMKKDRTAILTGQKSSGSPMYSENIPVDKDYSMVLQVARFFDSEGKSLSGRGTEPDIEISGPDILGSLLKKIN